MLLFLRITSASAWNRTLAFLRLNLLLFLWRSVSDSVSSDMSASDPISTGKSVTASVFDDKCLTATGSAFKSVTGVVSDEESMAACASTGKSAPTIPSNGKHVLAGFLASSVSQRIRTVLLP
mmetsp:Transcript_13530/g.24268  ORF Transcript_13530/g.24268 Transcript_13530/m.24268 type:complete len:122 (-) Transcript_13530:487-852(-)